MNLSVFSIPREKSTRGAGPQKEVDVLAHPPPQAHALAVALRFGGWGVREGDAHP